MRRTGPVWRRRQRRCFLVTQHRRLGRRRFSFRRGGYRWTAFPWDTTLSWDVYIEGEYEGPQRRALVSWLRRQTLSRGDFFP